jgi:hypothetical protein
VEHQLEHAGLRLGKSVLGWDTMGFSVSRLAAVDKALATKAAMFAELGVTVHLCGSAASLG